MDWTVTVKTQTGYIKNVVVYDYNTQSDAIDAALAQTGAAEAITAIPYNDGQMDYNKIPSSTSSTGSCYTQNSPYRSYNSDGPDFNLFEAITFFIGALLIPVGLLTPNIWYLGFLVMLIALIHFIIRSSIENLR